MFAGVRIGAHVLEGRVGEEDEVDGGGVVFEGRQERGGKGGVPADVDEDFDGVVEFEEGLDGGGVGLGAEEGGEVKHFCCMYVRCTGGRRVMLEVVGSCGG